MRNTFDKDHILSICEKVDNGPPTMDAQTAVNELCRYFLGSGWYSYLTSAEHVNVEIVCEIEKRYKGARLNRRVIYE